MAQLLPPGRQRYSTNIGTPLVGGKLYAYEPGTSTPRLTYADAAATTPNANPVILDANGEATVFWLGTYKVVLQDSLGNVQWTVDGVSSIPDGGSAAALASDLASTTQPAKGAAQIGRAQQVVASIALLRTLLKTSISINALVTGYYAALDGGGGIYNLDVNDSTTADNGGTVIVAADGGRWKLQYTDRVSILQFGARAGNTTYAATNATAIQAAVTWACDPYPLTASRGLKVPAGIYTIGAGITKGSSFSGLNMIGDGMLASVFSFTTAAGIRLVGGSGGLVNCEISDMMFTGISTSVLVELAGQCGQKLRRCKFSTSAEGLRFHNDTGGQFTEFCVAYECHFDSPCILPVRYKRITGNASFHGSGLGHGCVINASTGAIGIQIDAGCTPYNAPMHVQAFNGSANYSLIQNNNTSTPQPTFYGVISIETSGLVVLGNSSVGNEFLFAGQILANNPNFQLGYMYQCDMAVLGSDGSYQIRGAKFTKKFALVAGANTVPAAINRITAGTMLWSVGISGPNYDVRYAVMTGGYIAVGANAVPIATFTFNNSAGYGAPTFSINSASQLVITNANFPASGLIAYVEALQLGQTLNQFFIAP